MPAHASRHQLLLVAAALVILGGLFAMTDAALYSVSVARSGELAREGVRGAEALQAVASDVVRHLNLLLLLRTLCELGATTLVALVTIDEFGAGWISALIVSRLDDDRRVRDRRRRTSHDRAPACLHRRAVRRSDRAVARPGAQPAGVAADPGR